MTNQCPYRAFFDRKDDTIDGFFTIIDTRKPDSKVFNRLPARSGQAGYTHSSWIRGKSPIPFSKELGKTELMIHMQRPQNFEQWPLPAGVGEFWFISNSTKDPQTIQDPSNPKFERVAVGLHPENLYKGSAGCIVLLHDTESREKEVIRLHNFLLSLIDIYSYMPLTVL